MYSLNLFKSNNLLWLIECIALVFSIPPTATEAEPEEFEYEEPRIMPLEDVSAQKVEIVTNLVNYNLYFLCCPNLVLCSN